MIKTLALPSSYSQLIMLKIQSEGRWLKGTIGAKRGIRSKPVMSSKTPWTGINLSWKKTRERGVRTVQAEGADYAKVWRWGFCNKNMIFILTEHLQHPGTRLSPWYILSHLILPATLCVKYYGLPFTDEETNRIQTQVCLHLKSNFFSYCLLPTNRKSQVYLIFKELSV